VHPPQWVCEAIERLSPWARLGWHGERRQFAIIDLYPQRLASQTYRERWGDNGPVFGTDYDRLARVPIWIDEVSPGEVFSGRVIRRVARYKTSLRDRARRAWSKRQAGRRHHLRESAGEQGQYLRWRANKSPHSGTTIADKHITKSEKAIAAGDYELKTGSEKMPPLNPMGFT